jgi:biotin carboxylase
MSQTQQTVLILNGSHAEIPLIEAAKSLGYRVVTTGADPSGLGHPFADEYVPADFSDAEAILAVARDQGVVGIIAGCNDFAAITAAHVAHAMDLLGHDDPNTCIRLHHKDRFRETMEGLGLPSIRAVRVTDAQGVHDAMAELHLPVIVKPIDLTGGKGMTVCDSADEIGAAVEAALKRSRASHVVIEEYLTGSHHGFTCFIESGKVVWWFADDEQYFLNPFLVAGTSTPSSLPDRAIEGLVEAVETISRHLELVDGLVHIQCILTADGPRIIELCRRCPGDLYPEFVRISTGHDYADTVVRAELGLPLEIPSSVPAAKPTVRNCAMAATDGAFDAIAVSPEVEDYVVRQWPLADPGTPITDHLTQKQAIIFLQFSSMSDIQQHLARRKTDIRVLVKGT